MKKLFFLFLIISFLIILIYGCHNVIPQDHNEEAEQTGSESAETGTSPGPAPNSGDGVSDGPGWEKSFTK
jgi:hypothetical protein